MNFQGIGDRISSLSEKWGSLLLALVAALLSTIFDLAIDQDELAPFLGAAVTLGAITSGFVMASLSILTSLDTPFIRSIKATRIYFRDLRRYLSTALRSGIVLASYSILLLLFDQVGIYRMAVWSFLLVLCVGYLWRLSRVMLIIFDQDTLGTDSAEIDLITVSGPTSLRNFDG